MAQPNVVSVTSIYAQSVGFNLGASADAVLFTVAATKVMKINSILVANVDGTNAATFNISVVKADWDTDDTAAAGGGFGPFTADLNVASTVYIAKTVSVAPDSTLVVLETPFYLMPGDQFRSGASATSDLDLFLSYELIDDAT
jgi:hypothetical protein